MRGNTRRLLSVLMALAMVVSMAAVAPSAAAATGSTGTVVVDEDFSGRVLPVNWVDSGSAYSVVHDANYQGALYCNTSSGKLITISGVTAQNFTLTFDVVAKGSWFDVVINENNGSVENTSDFRMRFLYSGSMTLYYPCEQGYTSRSSTAAKALYDDATHTVKLEVMNNSLTTYIDGVERDTCTRDALTTRTLGNIGFYCQGEFYFDNIQVTSYDAGVEKPLENVVLSEDFDAEPSDTYWTDASNAYSVNDDGALVYDTSVSSGKMYYKYGCWTDFELSFDVLTRTKATSPNNWFQIMLRSDSGSLPFYFYFKDFNTDEIELYGNSKLITEKASGVTLFDGQWHHLRIRVQGTTIELYDGSTLLLSGTSEALATASPGSIGFVCTGFAYQFDNVKVTVPMDHMAEVLTEDFSDAASKGAWEFREVSSGTYDYTGGKLAYSNITGNAGGVARYNWDSWKNFEVSAKVLFPKSGWFQIGLRSTTDEGNLMGNYLYFSTFKSSSKYLELYGASGAKVTPVYQLSCESLFDGNEHDLRVQIIEDSVWVWADGNLIYVAADAALKDNEGSVAFKTYVTGLTFDDVQVISYDLPDLKFSGASLYLQSDLAIHYRVNANLFAEGKYTDPYLVVEMNGKQETITSYSLDTEKNQYVFQFSNIAPQQMGDTVTATLHATYEGQEYTAAKDYSVAQYCYSMLGNATYSTDAYAELRTLLVDLLNYGAAAQNYKNYKTDALVNADLTDDQKAWGTAELATALENHKDTLTTTENATVQWKGAGLYLENEVAIRLRFLPNEGVDVSTLTVNIATEDGSKTWTIGSEAFVEAAAGGYYVYFDGLNAGQMRQKLTIQVCDGTGAAVSDVISYSVVSYAYSQQNDDDAKLTALLDAMMKYGDSAYAYVN